MHEHPDAHRSPSCIDCGITTGDHLVTAMYQDDLVTALMTADAGLIVPAGQDTPPHAALLSRSDSHGTNRHGAWTVLRRADVRSEAADLRRDDDAPAASDASPRSRTPFTQDAPRVHIHVFPRYDAAPFHLVADWTLTLTPLRLDQIAGRIRQAYAQRAGAPPVRPSPALPL